MSVMTQLKAKLLADNGPTGVATILGGRIYVKQEDWPLEGLTRNGVPEAYSGTPDSTLLPIVAITARGEMPIIGVRDIPSEFHPYRTVVEFWFYVDGYPGDYSVLKQAAARVKTLINYTRLPGIYSIHWIGDPIPEGRAPELTFACLIKAEYEVTAV